MTSKRSTISLILTRLRSGLKGEFVLDLDASSLKDLIVLKDLDLIVLKDLDLDLLLLPDDLALAGLSGCSVLGSTARSLDGPSSSAPSCVSSPLFTTVKASTSNAQSSRPLAAAGSGSGWLSTDAAD